MQLRDKLKKQRGYYDGPDEEAIDEEDREPPVPIPKLIVGLIVPEDKKQEEEET